MALFDLHEARLVPEPSPEHVRVEPDADGGTRTAAVVAAQGRPIAIPFAKMGDGRGFTQARYLREKNGFDGELRAVGNTIPDQAMFLLRAGFDTVEVPEPSALTGWTRALSRYHGAYQVAFRNPFQLRRDATRERVAALAADLGGIDSLSERIRHIASVESGPLAFSTSLGIEDQAVLHGIVSAGADVNVFTLDTGRLFPETLETLAATERHFQIRIQVISPERADVEDLLEKQGVFGFRESVEARQACCNVRKVAPLHRALSGAGVWITGLRGGQSASREGVPLAAWDSSLHIVKVAPIADWTLAQVEAYGAEHGVPTNPLHAQGFPSIGCQPCTRAVAAGEDIRAGRWWWENETYKECGLHRPATETEEAP